MPIVHIDLLPRDAEVKRKVAKEVTEAICRAASCPPEAVSIIFYDMPAESYAVAGKLHCDK